MDKLFQFPDPVNETSARVVAAGVVIQVVVFVLFREGWLLVPLAYRTGRRLTQALIGIFSVAAERRDRFQVLARFLPR